MLAFVHIHKSGGTTVGWTLRSAFGEGYCEILPAAAALHSRGWEAPATAADLRFAMKVYPRLRSIGGHHVQPHSDLHEANPNLKFFTMVRDPLSMRASMYQHGVVAHGHSDLAFERWLAEPQSQNRLTKMIAGYADVNAAIRVIEDRRVLVGLTDRFDASMVMLKAFHVPNLDIRYRRMRIALDSSVAREILTDQRRRAMLREGIEADLELHDWIIHELYPRQERTYGPSLDSDTAEFRETMEPYRKNMMSQDFFQANALAKFSSLRNIAPFSRLKILRFRGMESGIYLPAVKAQRLRAVRRAKGHHNPER